MREAQDLTGCATVILPGSKNTRGDLDWLKESGWTERLEAYRAKGGYILGICGGYQMLGETVLDPQGFEGKAGVSRGLGFLPLNTVLQSPKITTLTRFSWAGAEGAGYEIHMGATAVGPGRSWLEVWSRNGQSASGFDGCISADGRVWGTYMHGLFDSAAITRKWLDAVGLSRVSVPAEYGATRKEAAFEALAAHAQEYLDLQGIVGLLPEFVQKKLYF